MLLRRLIHPLLRDMDPDDPALIPIRRRIIQEKPFLRQVYSEWYKRITAVLPVGRGKVLEVGSGPGFLQDSISDLITSEISFSPGVSVVLDAHHLPFANQTLQGIVVIDVLHHLCRPRLFFEEAIRCLVSDGIVAMVEPWVTRWSRFIYTRFHHEPFQVTRTDWESPRAGPLSGANGALPWIIFERDRTRFEQEFPHLEIRAIRPIMPFLYLISGGLTRLNLMPGWAFDLWQRVEHALQPRMSRLAMFALIVLRRIDGPDPG